MILNFLWSLLPLALTNLIGFTLPIEPNSLDNSLFAMIFNARFGVVQFLQLFAKGK